MMDQIIGSEMIGYSVLSNNVNLVEIGFEWL